MKPWKDLFRTHILERGLNYYEEGCVTLLEQTSTGYTAVVEGTDDYDVEIEIRADRVYDMYMPICSRRKLLQTYGGGFV